MASRSRAAGRVHRTRVRVLRWRMATGAVPLWRMVFGVARCARALHRSLARVRVARGALQPAVALMRKRHWPGTRLLPDRKRECRGYRTGRADFSCRVARDAVPSRRVVPVMASLAIARDGLFQVPVAGSRAVACGAGDGGMASMLEPYCVAPLDCGRGGDIQCGAVIALAVVPSRPAKAKPPRPPDECRPMMRE